METGLAARCRHGIWYDITCPHGCKGNTDEIAFARAHRPIGRYNEPEEIQASTEDIPPGVVVF
jgi:hypothetical protein